MQHLEKEKAALLPKVFDQIRINVNLTSAMKIIDMGKCVKP
jgi:hypothetical protein